MKFLDQTKDNRRKLSKVPKSTKKVPGIPKLKFEEGTCRSLKNVEDGNERFEKCLAPT